MIPQLRTDMRPAVEAMSNFMSCHLNFMAAVLSPFTATTQLMAKSSGVEIASPMEVSLPCRPIAEANTAAASGIVRGMQSWSSITQSIAEMTAPYAPVRATMKPVNDALRELNGTIKDLSTISAKTPETITIAWPVTENSLKVARPETREEIDNPSDVRIEFSPDPAINLAGIAACIHTLGANHAEYDQFPTAPLEVAGEKIAVLSKRIKSTDLSHHTCFSLDQDFTTKSLAILGPPLSGHPPSFVTPMRDHLLKAGHPVLIPDFKDPRTHTNEHTLETHILEYVDLFRTASEMSGGNYHAVAVCEPGSSMLAAAAYLVQTEGNHDSLPLSLTLINSPIVPGAAQNGVVDFANAKPADHFKRLLSCAPNGQEIQDVQLLGFLNKSIGRHMKGIAYIHNYIVRGDHEDGQRQTDNYRAFIKDRPIPGELYMGLIEQQFKGSALAKGELVVNGVKIDPSCLRDMVIHTVGATDDDVTHEDQCKAALAICPNVVSAGRAFHTLIKGTGHYGPWGPGKIAREVAMPIVMEVIDRATEEADFEPGEFIVDGNPHVRLPDIEPCSNAEIMPFRSQVMSRLFGKPVSVDAGSPSMDAA